jgi:hypothetical protein
MAAMATKTNKTIQSHGRRPLGSLSNPGSEGPGDTGASAGAIPEELKCVGGNGDLEDDMFTSTSIFPQFRRGRSHCGYTTFDRPVPVNASSQQAPNAIHAAGYSELTHQIPGT